MSGLSNTSAIDAFNRIEEKIEEQERESLAQQEVTEALGPGTMEEEFQLMETASTVDIEDRLIALKQGMGLIAPPEEDEPKQLEPGDDEAVETTPAASEGISKSSNPLAPAVQEAELIEEFDKLEQQGE